MSLLHGVSRERATSIVRATTDRSQFMLVELDPSSAACRPHEDKAYSEYSNSAVLERVLEVLNP